MANNRFERERAEWIRRSTSSPSAFGRAELPVRHPASLSGRAGEALGLTPRDIKIAVGFVLGLAALVGIPIAIGQIFG